MLVFIYNILLSASGFVFCRFEDEKSISNIFEELWEENTSGEQLTLQLYMKEIVFLICDIISSSSWASKKKVGYSILVIENLCF